MTTLPLTMPAHLESVSAGSSVPGSMLGRGGQEHDWPERRLLQPQQEQEQESEQETWEPAGLPNDVKHVPFGGLTLASAVNGVTYQHTLGALDDRSEGRERRGHRADRGGKGEDTGQTGQGRTGQDRTGQDRTGPDRTGQDWTG